MLPLRTRLAQLTAAALLAAFCAVVVMRHARKKTWVTGYIQRRAMFRENLAKDKGSVVFFGDSITEFWFGLPEAFPNLKVVNRGISGDTSSGLIQRLSDDVLFTDPTAVVMLIGTNDLWLGMPPLQIANTIEAIVRQIQEALGGKVPIVLCFVMPRTPVPGKFPELIVQLNGLIALVAARHKGVLVCDTYKPFLDEKGALRSEFFGDGLHLNERGYGVWRDALAPVLQSALASGRR